jgi:hypothetical protein
VKNIYKTFISTTLLSSALMTTSVSATVFEFYFTGQYTLLDPSGGYMDQQAIASTLTYDDNSGTGFSAGLTIENFDTFGATATIYDITLQRVSGTDLIIGNMLVDWNVNEGMPLSMVWDATGLFNAIDFGLQAGDVISGTNLKRGGVSIYDVQSAIPASDGTPYYNYDPLTDSYVADTLDQGPAPLAITTLNTSTLCTPFVDCIDNALSGGAPFTDDGISGSPLIDGPFAGGLNINFDIGSGNSLTVLNVSAVPVPAAVWLFGSGLLGLVGIAKRKKA